MNDDLISREALKKLMWDESYPIATFTECGTEVARIGLTINEIEQIIDNAPTVEYPEPITIKCDTEEDKQKLLSALRNVKLKAVVEEERPTGEQAERALAIIDRLRTDGHINNKEQGTLRRAILLPERPQGHWIKVDDNVRSQCSECGFKYADYRILFDYCPTCGADMRGGRE